PLLLPILRLAMLTVELTSSSPPLIDTVPAGHNCCPENVLVPLLTFSVPAPVTEQLAASVRAPENCSVAPEELLALPVSEPAAKDRSPCWTETVPLLLNATALLNVALASSVPLFVKVAPGLTLKAPVPLAVPEVLLIENRNCALLFSIAPGEKLRVP